MKRTAGFALIAVFALLGFLHSIAQADDKPVPSSKEWKGSVADAALAEKAPSCIASTKQLEKLWKDWKLAEKVPAVDFTKEIVVLATTRGSHIGLICSLSDTGDLTVVTWSTADFGDGFRYVMATVSREGVKTVDGKELPKD